MARDFSKVSPQLWRSNRFRSLETDDAKLLYLFLMTCDHQTSAGGFRLPDAYAVADLGWPAERLTSARTQLVESDLIVHDAATEEYYVLRWFRHNPTTNAKHLQGVERLLSKLDSDQVRSIAENELSESRGGASDAAAAEPVSISDRLTRTAFMSRGHRSIA